MGGERLMIKCVREVLEQRGGNYLLPFLWVHGEEIDMVLSEIDRIAECKIREFCVESRPHPGFLQESWWKLMDQILEKAKEKEMRVWLLDDQHFPTGYAAGAYRNQPQKAKIYLKEFHMDLCGPAEQVTLFLETALEEPEEVLGIWMYRRKGEKLSAIDLAFAQNLTDRYRGGRLCLDVPDGMFRLFVMYTGRTGGGKSFYMNLPDEASVRVLIDTVYESHYQRYQEMFGTTFAGFFSDEPELGNTPGYAYDILPGTKGCVYPWSNALRKRLGARWGGDAARYLPALWFDAGDETAGIRYDYMDMLTLEIRRCFSEQIGDWCRQHGVSYIGHIIEDNNAHGRLGCSVGHYFRAQAGQDMAGIDVVSQQLMPGCTENAHRWVNGEEDGEFFHFGLAKLGSSGAAVDAKKKGRTMCELFGAYGWGEGIALMKWLADHMLAQGVNVFVPHAFSPLFPDPDCPPHFFGQGQNPQFRFFGRLMRYINRAAHLLQNGVRRTEAAVLYPAESEWADPSAMPVQKPVRELLEHQMDCNILPTDVLEEVRFQDRGFSINGATYRVFLIPETRRIPKAVERFAVRAAGYRVPVFAINALPQEDVYGKPLSDAFRRAVTAIPMKKIGPVVRSVCPCSFRPEKEVPGLRTCCYLQKDGAVCMFLNEEFEKTIRTAVRIRTFDERERDRAGKWMWYRPMKNTVEPLKTEEESAGRPVCAGADADTVLLNLVPGETVFLFQSFEEESRRQRIKDGTVVSSSEWETANYPIVVDWIVSKAEISQEFEECAHFLAGDPLPNLNGERMFPDFSGTFRYEGKFFLEREEDWQTELLEFPRISECAEVWINGRYAGDLMENGYSIEVTGLFRKGENDLRIEVSNSLVWRFRDKKSAFMQIPPTGMTAVPILKCARSRVSES